MRIKNIVTAGVASVALCFGSSAAVANSCQGGSAGCLLPFQPAVAAPVVQTAPVVGVTEAAVVETAEGGIGIVPILIGLAALGAAAYFLLIEDDDDSVSA